MTPRNPYRIERLAWRDQVLAEARLPKRTLTVTLGLGSGLSRRPGDPPGRLWAVGDRGANLKVADAIEHYGLMALEPLREVEGAKILPLPAIGPMLCEIQIEADAVRLVRTLPITSGGRAISGLPPPGGDDAAMEPAFDITGAALADDPDGADSEGVCALADGTFWVAEEYAPSLIRVRADGAVIARWTPKGRLLPGATAPVLDVLPARAKRRRLNRGFEAIAATPDGSVLYVAFQSALDGEDRHGTLIWALDGTSGDLLGEFAYPFDAAEEFKRDRAAGKVRARDLKVSEMTWLDSERLLVLERISRSTKLYVVNLTGETLAKTLLLDTDDMPQIVGDLEGMALISDRELILVNDNDFGTGGAETLVFRVTFERPIKSTGQDRLR